MLTSLYINTGSALAKLPMQLQESGTGRQLRNLNSYRALSMLTGPVNSSHGTMDTITRGGVQSEGGRGA
eukprot:1157335-Pelagomonas_calceolata.AAC.5